MQNDNSTRNVLRVVWSWTRLVLHVHCIAWELFSLSQDPFVASHTSNAARGIEDFNPFVDQNSSKPVGAAKVAKLIP